jgi:hypothetical protein
MPITNIGEVTPASLSTDEWEWTEAISFAEAEFFAIGCLVQRAVLYIVAMPMAARWTT